MEVKVKNWKVSYLHKIKDKINAQPSYQRGEVWSERKQALLIDSMLRGIDIPKIYLRKIVNGAHDYEVADGQQRLNAIFQFYENQLPLLNDEEKGLDLKKINNRSVGGKTLSLLSNEFKAAFSNYEISVAIIDQATNSEIRILFGRLQEGEPLVPAEKRNAILSKIGTLVDNFAINHNFFINSKISAERFKRQDFLAHAFALVFYLNVEPLKANLLLKMYLDKSLNITHEIQSRVAAVLDVMYDIDNSSAIKIFKKYHFIDIFWFLYNNFNRLSNLRTEVFISIFEVLEKERLGVKNPESLISGAKTTQQDKDLYNYYMAFRFAGADPENISIRSKVFKSKFETAFTS